VWFTVEGDDGRQRRVFRSFADEADAWRFAEGKDREIANHGVRFGDVPPEVRRAVDYYRDTRIDLEAEGVTVPSLEDLLRDAVARLRAEHAERQRQSLTVADALEVFHEYKRSRVGERQRADLRDRLKRFAETFGTRKVSSIETVEIERWLSGLRSRRNPDGLRKLPLVGAQTRNHYRAALHAFFGFAASPAGGWCDANPVAHLEPVKVKTAEPEAYAVEDVAKILQDALDHRLDVLPALALQFFSGVRASELPLLDLATIPTEGGEFRVGSDKTGWRLAWLAPAGRAWLDAQPRKRGKAWTQSRRMLVDAVVAVRAAAGVKKINNGARHSFISYRVAELRDVQRVADECGNSPQTIKKHYRQLVTSEAAKRYFAITPTQRGRKGKVVDIKTGKSA